MLTFQSLMMYIDGEFRQQKLPAWQPVLTPRTVLPTLFIVGILFCPAGGLLWWNSNKVMSDTRALDGLSLTFLFQWLG